MANLINLESLCAEYGMRLVNIREKGKKSTALPDCANVINKALGVLVENGFYAMSVFLLSCNKKEYGEDVLRTLLDMLRDNRIALLERGSADWEDELKRICEITKDLPALLLARRLAEQALTFGRYHCKALNRTDN